MTQLSFFKRFICLSVLAVAGVFSSAMAENAEDIFIRAYVLIQDAQDLEGKNKPAPAADKYLSALNTLNQIAKAYPNWQPQIIEYRQKTCVTRLTAIREANPKLPIPAVLKVVTPNSSTETSVATKQPAKDAKTDGATKPAESAATQPAPNETASAEEPPVPVAVAPKVTEAPAPNSGWGKPGAQPTQAPAPGPAPTTVTAPAPVTDPAPAPVVTSSQPEQPVSGTVMSPEEYEKYQALKQEYDSLQAELESTRGQLSNLQADKESANTELAKANEEMKKILADLELAAEQNKSSSQGSQHLKTELQEMQQKLEQALADKKTLEAKLEHAVTAVQEAQAAAKNANAKLSDTNNVVVKTVVDEAAVAELALIKKQLDQVRNDKSSLEDQIQNTANALKKVEDQNRQYENQLAELQKRNGSLEEKLKVAEENLVKFSKANTADQVVSALREELERSRNELAAALSSNDQLKQENDGYRSQLQDYRSQLLAVKSDLESSQEIITASKQDVLTLQKEKALLQAIVDKQLANLAQQQQDLASSQKQKDELKAKLEELIAATSENVEAPAIRESSEPGETKPAVNSLVVDIEAPRAPERTASFAIEESDDANLKEIDQLLKNDPTTGFRRLQEYVAKEPGNTRAALLLGQQNYSRGNYAEAAKWLQISARHASDPGTAFKLLGISNFQIKKLDDAVVALTRSLSFNMQDGETHHFLGLTCWQKNWIREAKTELAKAVELNPVNGLAHLHLAQFLVTSPEPSRDEVLFHYERARELGQPSDRKIEDFLQPKLTQQP